MKCQNNSEICNKSLNQLFITINNNIIRDTNEEYDTRDLIGCEINCMCCSLSDNYTTNSEDYCECVRNKCGLNLNYDTNGLLINWSKPIYECGINCFCHNSQQLKNNCRNRITQSNSECLSQVFFDRSKGYSVRALNDLKFGQFIGEYCGEVIDRIEADNRFQLNKREEHNYILIFREHFGSESTFETIIDARNYGNESRLINHSCDPNLIALPVRSDSLRPRICLFASKDIKSGSELSYNYGSNESLLSDKLCLCKSEKCKQFMPLDFHQ